MTKPEFDIKNSASITALVNIAEDAYIMMKLLEAHSSGPLVLTFTNKKVAEQFAEAFNALHNSLEKLVEQSKQSDQQSLAS